MYKFVPRKVKKWKLLTKCWLLMTMALCPRILRGRRGQKESYEFRGKQAGVEPWRKTDVGCSAYYS